MKKITLCKLLILLITCSWANAQEARLQIIHNSPDLAAEQVDIYINGNLELNNFAFRTATEFLTVPAGVDIRIDVSGRNSTSSANSLYDVTVNLDADGTYIAVANGIVSNLGYSVVPNFAINLYNLAREFGGGITTDVLVNHGSPDAPMVDIFETSVPAGEIVPNLSYPQFAGYLELPTQDYVLDVRAQNGTTVASYLAPLQTLDLSGAAVTVLASGFLNPAANSNGPAFGLWVATATGGPLLQLPTATARVQVIHNSPDLAAAQVDVYINGSLELDNFAFRRATPFIDLPSGVSTSIDIKASNSNGNTSSPVLYNLTTTLQANQTYIIVANGIVSPTGYSVAPNFALNVFALGREEATNLLETDVLVNHGSPDAPTVNVAEVSVPAGTIVPNLSFPQFAGYLELPTSDYRLEVRDQTSSLVATYDAPLQELGLEGAAITVLASGFLNPAQNSNGPAFGLWVATATGGPLLPLPFIDVPTARIQIIHNCADLAAGEVDVYINDELRLNNFAFRTATPFITVPAGDLTIDVSLPTSTSSANSLYNTTVTLNEGETYIAIAEGIVSQTGYSPRQLFNLNVFSSAREEANENNQTDVLVYHGCTDAPAVDVYETAVPAGRIVDNIQYGDFDGYLELGTLNYTLDVRDETGTDVIASYLAPLQTLNLQGAAITVLASGFLDRAANSNGPGFGLWAATAAGGNLVQLPTVPLSNSSFIAEKVRVYPNPAKGIVNIDIPSNYEIKTVRILDLNGREVITTSSNLNLIDVSKLSDGVYMMGIDIDSTVINKKIIVRN